MRDYIIHSQSPRQYGLGKFSLFMPWLFGADAVSALPQCTGDFIVAAGNLVDHVPDRLAERLIACAVEMRRLHPVQGHQSTLAGSGMRTIRGSEIAATLVSEIYRLHIELIQYDIADAIANNRYDIVDAVAETDKGRSSRPYSVVLHEMLQEAASESVTTLAKWPNWSSRLNAVHEKSSV